MAQKYFNKLNYSMANEDSGMERDIVAKLGAKNILSVCGSGARAFALLSPEVESLDCVDLSSEQLSIARLRLELTKTLSAEDYAKFWGYPPFAPNDNQLFRKEVLDGLPASPSDRALWTQWHEDGQWESLLYKGKWESSFVLFGKIAKALLGAKTNELFELKDLKSQKEFMRQRFPWRRWNFLVRVIGNRATFNALLYKGDFIQKNVPENYFEYYSQAFNRLFEQAPARENFFLQLCMLGAIRYSEGNIPEAKEESYESIKAGAEQAMIQFHQGDLIQLVSEQESEAPWDYISLSDVPSYFSGPLETNFLQTLRTKLKSGAVVVLRSYLRVPAANREGYENISEQFAHELAAEKTQMYRVEILRKL